MTLTRDARDFGASPDLADSAPSIQKAVDAAHAEGGGIVSWVGRLRVQSQVRLPAGVLLQGVCPPMSYYYASGVQPLMGTILEVDWGYGAGAADSLAQAAVLLDGPQSGVERIAFVYPGQDPAATPRECGPTVAMTYSGHVNTVVRECFFDRSWVAIDARGYGLGSDGGVAYVDLSRNTGCPIFRGLRLSFLVDWAIVKDNAWNSGMPSWAHPGNLCALTQWIAANGIAYEYGSGDWYMPEGNDAWGYMVGVFVKLDPTKYPGSGPFHFVHHCMDCCQIPFYVSSAGGPVGEVRIDGAMHTAIGAYNRQQSCLVCVEDGAHVAKLVVAGVDVGTLCNQLVWAGPTSQVDDLRVIDCDISGGQVDAMVDMGTVGNVQMVSSVGRGFPALHHFGTVTGQLTEVGCVVLPG